LTFFANDVRVGSTRDSEFTRGSLGVSVSTFDLPGAAVRFERLAVRLPDPDNPPGC
jgi:hypothetical protein